MKNKKFLAGLTALLCCFQAGLSMTGYAAPILVEPTTEAETEPSIQEITEEFTTEDPDVILEISDEFKAGMEAVCSDIRNFIKTEKIPDVICETTYGRTEEKSFIHILFTGKGLAYEDTLRNYCKEQGFTEYKFLFQVIVSDPVEPTEAVQEPTPAFVENDDFDTNPTTEAEEQTTTEAIDFFAGDVTMDGNVDILDVITLNKAILGKETLSKLQNKLADVNRDGKIDSSDALAVLKQIVGIPEEITITSNTVNLSESVKSDEVTGKELDDTFIQSQTGFYLNLFQQAEKTNPDKNVLVSPYSAVQALGMTANGADGSTKAEMEQTLGGLPMETLNQYLYTQRTSQPNSEYCKLSTANSIWFRDDEERIKVHADFLQTNADYYSADAFKAPFDDTTVKDINSWCEEKTDGMIPELLEEIDGSAVMYLINAVVFDAKWSSPYNPEWDVKEADFTTWDGTVQKVQMMYSSNEYYYLEDEYATGFYKYYRGGDYAFAALLPEEGLSVDDYISSLTAESLQNTLSNPVNIETHTAMPKFSYDYDITLNQALQEMGMPEAFTGAANFSKMAIANGLFIGKVLQKTHIDVDEEGTKAAAVTVVEMNDGCELEEPEYKEVVLDRPFVYMIVDMHTHLPVFMGALKTVES